MESGSLLHDHDDGHQTYSDHINILLAFDMLIQNIITDEAAKAVECLH